MIMYLIVRLVDVYSFLIFASVLMSWVPHEKGLLADIYRALGMLCDPYLDLFKKFIPPLGGMVDISPILALLVLQFGVRLLAALFSF